MKMMNISLILYLFALTLTLGGNKNTRVRAVYTDGSGIPNRSKVCTIYCTYGDEGDSSTSAISTYLNEFSADTNDNGRELLCGKNNNFAVWFDPRICTSGNVFATKYSDKSGKSGGGHFFCKGNSCNDANSNSCANQYYENYDKKGKCTPCGQSANVHAFHSIKICPC
eukprot:358107_1